MKRMGAVLLALAIMFCMVPVTAQAAPMDKAVVGFSFDDADITAYTNVYPLFKSYGLPFTLYVPTGPNYIGTSSYCTNAQLWEMWWYGIEMGNHTEYHLHWATLTDAQILAEIVNAKNDLLKQGLLNMGAFTPPFGDPYDYQTYPGLYARMIKILAQCDFITSSRVPWDDTDTINAVTTFNPMAINSYQLENPRTFNDAKAVIDRDVAEKGMLIFTSHKSSSSTLAGDLDIKVLQAVVQYVASLKAAGKLNVVTVSEGVAKMNHYKQLP